jgi:hypothetical protein
MREHAEESNNPDDSLTQTPAAEPMVKEAKKRSQTIVWIWRGVVLLTVGGLIWLGVFILVPYRPSATVDPNEVAAVQKETAKPASIESRLLGVWEDDYHGKRTLTLRADGTGTMICELAGWEATLFAEKLTFEEAWFVKNGALTMRVTGGEPAGKINVVLKMQGDTTTQEIVELTPQRLLLWDEKGKKKFDWRRVAQARSTEK